MREEINISSSVLAEILCREALFVLKFVKLAITGAHRKREKCTGIQLDYTETVDSPSDFFAIEIFLTCLGLEESLFLPLDIQMDSGEI